MKTTDWGNTEESKLRKCDFFVGCVTLSLLVSDIVAAVEFGR